MFLSKYGVARHIYIPVVKRAVVDFAVSGDWTPAAGDVKISKDGGAAANVTNLPVAITMGNTAIWDFSLTATEMQAAQVVVTVADSATKAVEDQSFIVQTYGNASAMYQIDLADVVRMGLTALPNAAAEAAGGLYTRGSGAGQINQPANGMVDANVVRNAGTAITAAAGIQEVKVASIATDAITAASIQAGAIGAAEIADGAIDAATFAAGAIDAAAIATDAIDADAIKADAITEIQAGLATASALTTVSTNIDTLLANLAVVAGYIDTEVAAIKAKTDNLPGDPADQSLLIAATDSLATAIGAVSTAISALNDLSAAEVNAEVVDALSTDTYAEPGQAAPAATASLAAKINYLYKAWRNKKTQTSTLMSLYSDNGLVVDQKATVEDDGTTFTAGEVSSGP